MSTVLFLFTKDSTVALKNALLVLMERRPSRLNLQNAKQSSFKKTGP